MNALGLSCGMQTLIAGCGIQSPGQGSHLSPCLGSKESELPDHQKVPWIENSWHAAKFRRYSLFPSPSQLPSNPCGGSCLSHFGLWVRTYLFSVMTLLLSRQMTVCCAHWSAPRIMSCVLSTLACQYTWSFLILFHSSLVSCMSVPSSRLLMDVQVISSLLLPWITLTAIFAHEFNKQIDLDTMRQMPWWGMGEEAGLTVAGLTKAAWSAAVHGVAKSQTQLSNWIELRMAQVSI